MMVLARDWRSVPAYAYAGEFDRSEFAWEFLRRNPECQRDYQAILRQDDNDDLAEAFARRWGLQFRR
jgi:hypothetical protein